MTNLAIDPRSLVVGVTGHRNIACGDEARLRAAFGSVLDALSRSSTAPLVVLSGLAAGSDTLAAQEAIERGLTLVAALPMPLTEYEKDFTREGIARLHELIASAAQVVIVSETRAGAYERLGAYVARQSQVLVAFWDGLVSRGPGGTAHVVSMHSSGPTYQILTPRDGEAAPKNAFSVVRLDSGI